MAGHPPRLIAYIDEAGDSGNKYGGGSSEFLAIGSAVTAIAEVDSVLKIFSEARGERQHSKTFKKFSSNNEKDNFVLTKMLESKPVRTVMVAIHKPSMVDSHIRSHPQKEYQFLVKWALERVSWIARDSAATKGGKPEENRCKLIFSEQKTYPYEDLCAYLNKLRRGGDRFNCAIEWEYLHPDIGCERHRNEQPSIFQTS
jgi:hypothetical protein